MPLAGNARLNTSLTRRLARFLSHAEGDMRLATATPSRDAPIRFFLAKTTNHSLLTTLAPGEKSNPSRRPIRRNFCNFPRGKLCRGRSCRPDSSWPESDANAGAALGTARANHGPAALGLHADQEPVRALALGDRWLVSAFHDVCLW